jgi:hypothetical protein
VIVGTLSAAAALFGLRLGVASVEEGVLLAAIIGTPPVLFTRSLRAHVRAGGRSTAEP